MNPKGSFILERKRFDLSLPNINTLWTHLEKRRFRIRSNINEPITIVNYAQRRFSGIDHYI